MNIKDKNIKILTIGITFFLAGLVFFVWDWSKKDSVRGGFYSVPAATQNARTGSNLFAGYLPPENFRHFTYAKTDAAGNDFLDFSGECRDKYLTVLVFAADTDYRDDPARAVANRAIDCPADKKFSYRMFFNELGGLLPGEYYAFAADQGERGLWYNPR